MLVLLIFSRNRYCGKTNIFRPYSLFVSKELQDETRSVKAIIDRIAPKDVTVLFRRRSRRGKERSSPGAIRPRSVLLSPGSRWKTDYSDKEGPFLPPG